MAVTAGRSKALRTRRGPADKGRFYCALGVLRTARDVGEAIVRVPRAQVTGVPR